MADNPLKAALGWVSGLGGIALFGLVMLILFGNLSGNTGFAANTAGYNNTESVIGNYTVSVTNTSAQFPVVGTIIGIAILLAILIGVAVYALKKFNEMGGAGNTTFG